MAVKSARPRGHSRARSGWVEELDDAGRGLASGFLIGIPVVFTVDSWWLGEQVAPMDALALLGLAYVLTLAAVYWIGFHRGRRQGWDYFADALEALALAVLALIVVFWTLGQIGDGQAAPIALGRIAVAAGPVALGVAVANHLLPRDVSRSDPDAGDATFSRAGKRTSGSRATVLELAASVAGAFFICLSIVPVDDLNEIATEVPARNLVWVILLSVAVSYSVVFAAGFTGERRRHGDAGPLQHPLTETVVAYVAALAVSIVMLRVFGRLDAESAPLEVYAKAILLAFPASMGAAAGRLVV